jgi:transposase
MKFYCRIDLSARDCHLCVIDEQLKVVLQLKLRNDIKQICQLLGPYRANLKIVVESTFNWYWLIDGLQAEDFECHNRLPADGLRTNGGARGRSPALQSPLRALPP